MKRCRIAALPLFAALAALAQTPDRQLAFAEDLHAKGEDAFALLEFRRFVFHNPSHAQTPLATLRLARLYASASGNLAVAKETCDQLVARFPDSPLAAEAKAFGDFVEINSDYDGEPLQLWLKAESLEKQKRFPVAVAALERIATDYPKARLADDALYRIGVIQHESLGKTADAQATFRRLAQAYPESEWLVQAEYQAATALAGVEGKDAEAAAALRQFAAKHPESPLAKEAAAKALELERRGLVLKRQFDAGFVRPYTVRQGKQAGDRYEVDIQVGVGLSQREVQATMEDALVKEGAKRAKPQDQVLVQAYFNFPITKAGRVAWTPGAAPAYEVEKRSTKNLLFDVGIDILTKP